MTLKLTGSIRHFTRFSEMLILFAAIVCALCIVAPAHAADCAPPLPTDKDIETPGTDACPATLPKLSCTENFYLRQDGTGSDPTTTQGALGPRQFNDAARWNNVVAKDGKIGPGDCVQIIGTVTGPLVVHASGLAGTHISILGVDDPKFGQAQVVGSVPFRSSDYVWFKGGADREAADQGADRGPMWYTDGSKRKPGCEAAKPAGCDHPGIAASLGLENCRALWIGDRLAGLKEPADFRWADARGGKGDRLMLFNATADPNTDALQLRCAAHTGERINRNSCGAAPGQDKYFCEGLDYPAKDFGLYVGDNSYIDVRSLRVNYSDVGIGLFGDAAAGNHDFGHNTVRCVTMKQVDKAGVLIERQSLGHEEVSDSAFYGTGDGVYANHPDGGEGHALCRNYFVGINENGRNNTDGHAIGLQQVRDVSVEWNYIERARMPIGVWAWREDPRGRATNNVRIRYNHIVGAAAPQSGQRRSGDGAGIILWSGDAVYGNEVAYNLIENHPAGGASSLLVGIWAGGSGSATKPPNRFMNNTIIGAGTSLVIGKENVSSEFTKNLSYMPTNLHILLVGRAEIPLPHFSHNLYYPAQADRGFQLRGGKQVGFDRWQGAAGEKDALTVDPQFENAAARDYRLRESSPAKHDGIGAEASLEARRTANDSSTP